MKLVEDDDVTWCTLAGMTIFQRVSLPAWVSSKLIGIQILIDLEFHILWLVKEDEWANPDR